LERLTGFRPRTSLGDIVDRVIAFYRGEKTAVVASDTSRAAAQAATD
jgi:hypothetical protein